MKHFLSLRALVVLAGSVSAFVVTQNEDTVETLQGGDMTRVLKGGMMGGMISYGKNDRMGKDKKSSKGSKADEDDDDDGSCSRENICRDIFYGPDGATFIPPKVPNLEFLSDDDVSCREPECRKTCDTKSDKYFVELLGLQTSNMPNIVSLGNVTNEYQKKKLIQSFGRDMGEPLSAEARHCIQNPDQFQNGTQKYIAASAVKAAVPMFSPPWHDLCGRKLGSMGLFFNNETNCIECICNPNSAGLQLNKLAADGSIDELYDYCGYKGKSGNGWGYDILEDPSCAATLTAAPCQQNITASGGHGWDCYCMYSDTVGLHCPVFGPIFYINAKMMWNLGGDLLDRMPGKRVFCKKAELSDCTDACRIPEKSFFSPECDHLPTNLCAGGP